MGDLGNGCWSVNGRSSRGQALRTERSTAAEAVAAEVRASSAGLPRGLRLRAQGGGIRDGARGMQTPTDLFIKETAAKVTSRLCEPPGQFFPRGQAWTLNWAEKGLQVIG